MKSFIWVNDVGAVSCYYEKMVKAAASDSFMFEVWQPVTNLTLVAAVGDATGLGQHYYCFLHRHIWIFIKE